MKLVILGLAIAANTFTACNSNNANTAGAADTKETATTTDTSKAVQQHSADTTAKLTAAEFPSREIISNYLQLKNALTKDNGKDAAAAGNAIVVTLAKADMKTLSGAQMKAYMDIADDLKENAEHIGANADKIAHQREHFVLLSKDIADFTKTFGNGGQTLYKDFCPMANDGKGAIWISESKEIKNPYLGKAMPTCGTLKETIQ